MQIINLYRYENSDGSVSVTPTKRDESDEVWSYRVIADEGKGITDGNIVTECIDTHTPAEWSDCEIDDDEAGEADFLDALERLGVADEEE